LSKAYATAELISDFFIKGLITYYNTKGFLKKIFSLEAEPVSIENTILHFYYSCVTIGINCYGFGTNRVPFRDL